MLNRLTVSALLKTVILVTSFCVVVGFSLNAWDSWGRLQAASRIAVIADASANLFKAMHNLRTDRSTTNRLLNADAPMDADIEKYLRNIRDTEMPAMGNALGLLGGIEFAQQATLVPEFDRLFKTLTALQKEFWDAMGKPKAARRPTLAKEYMETTAALLATLDKLSGALAAAVNHQDADDRPVAGDQADRLAAAQHRRRSLADRLERARRRQGRAGDQGRLHQIRRRHRGRMERAGTDGVGNAVAAGAFQRDGRDQDRLFRAAISQPARAPADAGCFRREARNDRQPVDPDHGRTPVGCRRRRRGRARRRQGPCRVAARRSPALAGAATRCCWSARWRLPSAPW